MAKFDHQLIRPKIKMECQTVMRDGHGLQNNSDVTCAP